MAGLATWGQGPWMQGWQGRALISLNTRPGAQPRTQIFPAGRHRGLHPSRAGWAPTPSIGGHGAQGLDKQNGSSPQAPPTCASVSLLCRWGHKHALLCRAGGVHIRVRVKAAQARLGGRGRAQPCHLCQGTCPTPPPTPRGGHPEHLTGILHPALLCASVPETSFKLHLSLLVPLS